MAKKRMIDTDEKSIRLILEGIKYAKEHDLIWAQRVYSGRDKGDNGHACGSYCCILGHIGNKYNVEVHNWLTLSQIVDTNYEQRQKLSACFLYPHRVFFLDAVAEKFGKRARKRIERASEGLRIEDESN